MKKRLKFHANIISGQAPSGDKVSDHGAIPFLQGCAEFGAVSPKANKYCDEPSKLAPQNSILVSVRAPVGRMNTADRAYGIGRGLAAVVAQHSVNREYLRYTIESAIPELQSESTGSTYDAISSSDIGNLSLPFPDIETQRQIADFLDRETARIDLLIEKKQRLVKLLEEKRLALISRSTITGLNPDAEMRNSGVAWIGNIPKHWSMMPIKYLVSKPLIDGPHVTPTKREEGVTFISAEAISGGRIDFGKKWGFISEEDHKTYSKRYKPQRDDLFVVKLGATTGRIARVETDDDFNIWVPLAAIRPQNATLSKHIYYALQSRQVNDGYKMLWTYGTQQTLGLGTLSNLRIPVPQKAEMEEISKRLDEQLPRFDDLKEKALQSIDRLKEYRSALITTAVTGQIDVASHSRSGVSERRLDALQEEF